MSLRQRLFTLAGIALAPALLILIYNEVALRQSREAEGHALALRIGELSALEMARIVSGTEGVLVALAQAPVVRGPSPEPCGAYLAEVLQRLPHLVGIAAIDRDGTLRCRSAASEDRAPLPTASFKDRPYLAEALKTERFVIGEYVVARLSDRPTLPLAAPIRDETGAVVGVLAAGLDLAWLGRQLREREFSRGSALTIADRNGVIIAREPFPERFVGTRIPEPFLSLVNAAAPGTREVQSQDGTRRIIGYVPAGHPPRGLYVSAGVSRDEVFAPIDRAMQRNLIVALLGSALAFFAAWAFGRSTVQRPVAQLVGTIAAWRLGNREARTGMRTGRGELEGVGAAVDGLLDELAERQAARERAEERQGLLINELNHRVKNTLATVQSVAMQTLKNAASPSEARAAFESRLMALSRAHDVLTRENWEAAKLRDIVAEALAPYGGGANRIAIRGPDLRVPPRTALALAMALQELATNAVKHGALSNAAGTIAVRWEVEPSPPRLRLRWQEAGGPPVTAPRRRGFGSRLLERSLALDLDGAVTIAFEPEGVVCTIEAPLAA